MTGIWLHNPLETKKHTGKWVDTRNRLSSFILSCLLYSKSILSASFSSMLAMAFAAAFAFGFDFGFSSLPQLWKLIRNKNGEDIHTRNKYYKKNMPLFYDLLCVPSASSPSFWFGLQSLQHDRVLWWRVTGAMHIQKKKHNITYESQPLLLILQGWPGMTVALVVSMYCIWFFWWKYRYRKVFKAKMKKFTAKVVTVD